MRIDQQMNVFQMMRTCTYARSGRGGIDAHVRCQRSHDLIKLMLSDIDRYRDIVSDVHVCEVVYVGWPTPVLVGTVHVCACVRVKYN